MIDHITEFGVECGRSLFTFMLAKPKRLISYDIIPIEQYGIERKDLKQLALENNIDYDFITGDTTKIEIENTDLLFIDTLHTYDQYESDILAKEVYEQQYHTRK